MNRKERLDYLVEQFSVEYRELKSPEDQEGKKRLLRSLMNLRGLMGTAERCREGHFCAGCQDWGLRKMGSFFQPGCETFAGNVYNLSIKAPSERRVPFLRVEVYLIIMILSQYCLLICAMNCSFSRPDVFHRDRLD